VHSSGEPTGVLIAGKKRGQGRFALASRLKATQQ
jgi:hypothetical protein